MRNAVTLKNPSVIVRKREKRLLCRRSSDEFNATRRRQMEMTRLAPCSSMNRWSQRMLRCKNLETRWATGLNSRYRERKHRLSSCLYLRLPFSLSLLPSPSLSPSFLFFSLSFSLSRTCKFSRSRVTTGFVHSTQEKQCFTGGNDCRGRCCYGIIVPVDLYLPLLHRYTRRKLNGFGSES